MHVVTGTVVEGKVVLDSAAPPEGTAVTVLVQELDAPVRLAPDLQVELEQALDDADREDGISADELLAQIKKYG